MKAYFNACLHRGTKLADGFGSFAGGTIRCRFHAVNKELGRRGVRFMFGKNVDDPEWSLVRIHPGGSGLDPREVLDRLLGHAS